MSFVNQIDPNLVVGILVALGTYLWHKARGDKTTSARDILDSIVTQVINSDGVDLENVKARTEAKCRAALAKAGIKGTLAETLVHEAVEYASAQLHERFDLFTKSMNNMMAETLKLEQTVKAIQP